LALKRDDGLETPPLDEIKQAFAETVDDAIETIAHDCVSAAPGALYLAQGSDIPAIPRDADLPRLRRHEVSARGTVPIFCRPG
jgi:hypothetical protein